MRGLEIVVAIGVALLVASYVARRTGWSQPVLLLVAGVALGSIPALRGTPLPPEVVLVLFLPALLYPESLTTSLREIRRNARVITLNATVLVAATAVAVAATAHALGMPWPSAFVLGAAIAPTDATAIASVARRLPRRAQTILRAESLINDGTALVIYAVAVSVAIGGSAPNGWEITGRFALAYGVGAAIGVVAAYVAAFARRLAHDTILETAIGVVTPFAAYLGSEQLRGSGVVSVVVCGLVLSQLAPRQVSAVTRLQENSFWHLASYLLNGTLFLLVGLQVYPIVQDLSSADLLTALRDSGLVLGVVIGTRLVSAYTLVYLIRAIDRRAVQRAMRASARQRFAVSWAGPRGAISLAAALAVPALTDDGEPFPRRDLIVFATFVVIIGTLVFEGLTLGRVVRWSRLPQDTAEEDEIEQAHKRMGDAARAAVGRTADELHSPPHAVERLKRLYEDVHRDDEDDFQRLQRAVLEVKRAEMVRMRDAQEIDDIVLRRLEAHLDREEVSLSKDADDP